MLHTYDAGQHGKTTMEIRFHQKWWERGKHRPTLTTIPKDYTCQTDTTIVPKLGKQGKKNETLRCRRVSGTSPKWDISPKISGAWPDDDAPQWALDHLSSILGGKKRRRKLWPRERLKPQSGGKSTHRKEKCKGEDPPTNPTSCCPAQYPWIQRSDTFFGNALDGNQLMNCQLFIHRLPFLPLSN